jgi:two-component system response regulator AtoC
MAKAGRSERDVLNSDSSGGSEVVRRLDKGEDKNGRPAHVNPAGTLIVDELRQPLSTLNSNLETLFRNLSGDDSMRPLLEGLLSDLARIDGNLQRLLDPGKRISVPLSQADSALGFGEIIGAGPAMRRVFQILVKVAPVKAMVLITGESGTGKELVARAIHRRSPRVGRNFVAVNCSAIPQTLVESEFFGHEKGAFTDACVRRTGRFEEADGGSLFLDEVGDLALEAQAKVLRVLQDQQVTPVGGGRSRRVDVRVVAATNRDLAQEVEAGRFRSDLFWRLNVVPIRLPPLRERKEDIPALCGVFVKRFSRELGIGVESVSPEAQAMLVAYHWPGNVRELENMICRSIVLCEGRELRPQDLPPYISGEAGSSATDDLLHVDNLPLSEAVRETTERLEKRIITARLALCGGNRTVTARSLGISRKTLFNKLRQFDG